MALAVVQVDELLVRRVVAREHIEVTVAIDVCQRGRVGSIRRRSQVRRHEAAFPVVDQHAIEERRVPSLRQDDVEITIAIKVAKTHVCRILRRGFETDDGVEAAQNCCTLSGHHHHGQYDDDGAGEPRHETESFLREGSQRQIGAQYTRATQVAWLPGSCAGRVPYNPLIPAQR